ncbi:FHA domain-containing protein [Auritidibacter sp. NML100628]|uniref:FHA domain-containing protein FhaB/FipA n=1 Tax=Auritidibacter sp. NML100628 TaxID=2170742 RepID=UPI000D729778|nr:FHA domain-containing protein [Auritidibacter sp. NML100628]PXA76518.1 FHA domain-containing protein [Auritidibacter sp. NML100628]
MSELAVAALRLGLLAALWVLIIAIVASQGRDLMVGRRNKVRGQQADAIAVSPDGAPASQGPRADAPSAPPRALATQLVVTEGPLSGHIVDLQGAPLMMGRAAERDLVLDDDYVSGRHARLFPQGTRWFLEDLGSTNGTYINGAQLARTLAVEPGTPIRIGKTVLELRQ